MLHLKTTPSFIENYQNLLRENWTLETIPATLNLIDEFLNNSESPLGFSRIFPRESQLDPSAPHGGDITLVVIPPYFIEYLQNFITQLNADGILSVVQQWSQKRAFSQRQLHSSTAEIVYNLTFPLLVNNNRDVTLSVTGDVGFLRDTQSLLFLLAASHILPVLKSQNKPEEFSFLVAVLLHHCLTSWYDNLAHQNYLLSVLFENLGVYNRVLYHLYVALQLTPPTEHDYLTKAQTYWSALIDQKKFNEAEEFIFRLLQQCREEHFAELREMLKLSLELNADFKKQTVV